VSRRTGCLIALVVVCLTGCGASDVDVAQAMHAPPQPVAVEAAGPITVASFDFTESRIVAEIYAQALEAARAWRRARCSNPRSSRGWWT
jgi:glycine betaine/choline ABC-type transport system substrate-binding protein